MINLREATEQLEQRLIDEALRLSNGNKSAAAKLLGLKRTTLIAKLKRKTSEEVSIPAAEELTYEDLVDAADPIYIQNKDR